MKQLQQLSEPFLDLIYHIFRRQTSTILIILGRRGTGKTDLALLIAEILFNAGIIKTVATNIKIYNAPFLIKAVDNLDDLKGWASETKERKLFIFDEIGKAMRRRSPMSSLNVKLIDQFHIFRKYKLSTIATTISEKYVDTAILGSDILDGYFRKPSFRNRKLAYYVDYLEPFERTIIGIPSTSVDFDTWDSAPFQEHGKQRKPHFKDKDLETLWDWSHGKTCRDLGLHKMKINRLVRKFIRTTLESKSQVT